MVAHVLLLVGEEARGVSQVLGIDPVRYRESFPRTIAFEEGCFWKDGEGGLILNASSDSISQGPLSRVGWCDIDSLRLLKGYTLEAATPALVERLFQSSSGSQVSFSRPTGGRTIYW